MTAATERTVAVVLLDVVLLRRWARLAPSLVYARIEEIDAAVAILRGVRAGYYDELVAASQEEG